MREESGGMSRLVVVSAPTAHMSCRLRTPAVVIMSRKANNAARARFCTAPSPGVAQVLDQQKTTHKHLQHVQPNQERVGLHTSK